MFVIQKETLIMMVDSLNNSLYEAIKFTLITKIISTNTFHIIKLFILKPN